MSSQVVKNYPGFVGMTRVQIAAFEAMREALQAIEARHNGEYDLPALMKQGPLSTSTHDDVIRIARAALALAEEVSK